MELGIIHLDPQGLSHGALIPVFLSCPDASGSVPAMHVPAASAAANAAAINLLIFIFILLVRWS